MIKVGDKVSLRRPKKVHPWRRGQKIYVGGGVVLSVEEVAHSEWVQDGLIYHVLWRGKEIKCVSKEIMLDKKAKSC